MPRLHTALPGTMEEEASECWAEHAAAVNRKRSRGTSQVSYTRHRIQEIGIQCACIFLLPITMVQRECRYTHPNVCWVWAVAAAALALAPVKGHGHPTLGKPI